MKPVEEDHHLIWQIARINTHETLQIGSGFVEDAICGKMAEWRGLYNGVGMVNKILHCPLCKKPMHLDGDRLVCETPSHIILENEAGRPLSYIRQRMKIRVGKSMRRK